MQYGQNKGKLAQVNDYRYGVLIGNSTQQRFGIDLLSKQPQTSKLPKTQMKQGHPLKDSLYQFHPVISKQPERTQNFYLKMPKYANQQLIKPQAHSTYTIFHRRKVEPYIPLLQNNCKKQDKHAQIETELYQKTQEQLKKTFGYNQTNRFYQKDIQFTNMLKTLKDGSGIISKQKHIIQLPFGTPQDFNDPNFSLTGSANGFQPGKSTLTKSAHLSLDPNALHAQSIQGIKAKSFNPFATREIIAPQLKQLQQLQQRKYVFPNQEQGQQAHILKGHGIDVTNDFHKREFATIYDLSYNQHIEPRIQIHSKFIPDLTKTARQFHKELVYQKNHQPQISQLYNKKELYNDKIFRPYRPFTKTYDQTHMKNQFLRKAV